MAKRKKIAAAGSRWDAEIQFVMWLATCVSVLSFLFYFQRGEVLLYGDAVAHLNIARRVFDSKTPGLLQLGTVWLPLPHLLMIPFLISGEMWKRGVGGSIPSMAAYVLSVVGIFRLMREVLTRAGDAGDAEAKGAARIATWTAAFVYAANPNLIYMQTTAMGEALYLAFIIWALVYFAECLAGDVKALNKCGLCLAATCLTRYDGWFLAVAMAAAVLALSVIKIRGSDQPPLRISRPALARFVFLAAAAPLLWLAYNGIVYRNPLEFANGPYSAKAIERRTQSAGNPGHPGSGNVLVAGVYFLKSGEANMAENPWLQRSWVMLAIVALVGAAFRRRILRDADPPNTTSAPRWFPLLFLLLPIPFYALSVAYGGVPIFVPAWWPFTHYNVRYGLQLLPAFATAFAIAVYLILRTRWRPNIRPAAMFAMFAVLIASYATVWRATPISLKEAQINMRTRNILESQLVAWLDKLPPDATLLMYLGDHVGALQQAGIPLKHVINEGNHRVWMQPSDQEGLWERALADPAKYADYVVACEGDPVWQAIQGRHLRELVELHVTGQARTVLFRAR
jgi:hypothetical protein